MNAPRSGREAGRPRIERSVAPLRLAPTTPGPCCTASSDRRARRSPFAPATAPYGRRAIKFRLAPQNPGDRGRLELRSSCRRHSCCCGSVWWRSAPPPTLPCIGTPAAGEAAGLVVDGQVVSSRTVTVNLDGVELLATEATVKVDRVHADPGAATVTVRVPGGRLGTVLQRWSHSPVVRPGMTATWFLADLDAQRYRLARVLPEVSAEHCPPGWGADRRPVGPLPPPAASSGGVP